MDDQITPKQSRMARAALDLSIAKFAAMARISPTTLSRFEQGESVHLGTALALRTAFEKEGIEFVGGGVIHRQSKL